MHDVIPWLELEVVYFFLRNQQTHRQDRPHQSLLSQHLLEEGKPALYAATKH